MNFAGLPVYEGKRELIKGAHDVFDIVEEICNAHERFSSDYDLIAKQFSGDSVRRIYSRLFDFCKKNMVYRAESANYQTTRSPAAILQTAKTIGVDCKHYALFIAGVLDALRRAGKKINWKYRFVSYDLDNRAPSHVFVVAKDEKGNDVYIDPVLSYLDCRFPKYFYSLDKKNNMLERISGIGLTFNKDAIYTSNLANNTGIVPLQNNPLAEFRPASNGNKKWLLIAGGALLLIFILQKSKKRGK